MTPERYRRIGEIFDAALELPFEDRSAYLKQASDGDASLLDEVEKLLANHSDSHTFLPLRENAHFKPVSEDSRTISTTPSL